MVASLNCAACGSGDLEFWGPGEDIEYFTTTERFSYHRCLACDALTIDPVPSDQLRIIYPPNYYSYAPASKSLIAAIKGLLDRARYRSLLRRVPGSELRVLDIGGGHGATLDLIRSVDKRVASTTVVDFDARAQSIAEGSGHVFFLGRIEDFQSPQGYDVIFMLNLIEHVADPAAVLTKARELLADDGIIVLQTPNYRSFDASLFRKRSWGGLHCPRHWVIFDRESFRRLSAKLGLATLAFAYTQGAPFWAWSVMNELRRLGLVRYNAFQPVQQHWLTMPLMGIFAAFDIVRGRFWRTSQMVFVLQRDARVEP